MQQVKQEQRGRMEHVRVEDGGVSNQIFNQLQLLTRAGPVSRQPLPLSLVSLMDCELSCLEAESDDTELLSGDPANPARPVGVSVGATSGSKRRRAAGANAETV